MTVPRLSGPLALALVAGLTATAAPAAAQSAGLTAVWEPPPARDQAFELTIENVMRGSELVGQEPAGVQFSDDGEWIYFRWLPGGHDWHADRELWRVPAGGGEPELVPDDEEERLSLTLAAGDLSPDGRSRVVSMDGDLWLVDRSDGSARRLTDTRDAERSPFFGPDGRRIFYQQGDNLFSMGLDGSVRQVTDIRSGTPPRDETEAEGQRGFLEEQQEELFDHVRRQREEQARRDSIREARREGEPEPVWIPPNERLGGLSASPDGSYVVLQTFEPSEGDKATPVPFWITESGYTESRDVRNKVGDAQGSARVGFTVTATGETTWIEARPEGYEGGVRTQAGGWNDAGTHALVVSRSDDNKDWWLYALESATGELTLLDHVHDEAWVAGPCRFGCEGWVPGTDRAYWVTEATGYAHLYTGAADGSGKRQLTSGDWEVLDVEVPEGGGRFLLTTNEGSPFNQHVGWLPFDGGGDVEYLTAGDGAFEVTLSPDRERLAVVHSVANRPPELFVASASSPTDLEQVTVSPTEEWLTFPWVKPEIVRFEAEDGTMVPARVYRPSDMGARPNGAGVVFVHGAGYLHNVHNYWSSYYREYMFNHLLAASGYTVMDIDYRGSAGYGRDWRTAIYRWMGGKDLSDQVDGAEWMVANEGVDPDRVGIYGGSYGGFITLMALFTAGDTFRSGAALRSVTDWAHYNHPYTSNILNVPQEDPEAYRRSSPIYFAENMRPDQHLLIAHGMVDTNVHFSDVVRLAQRLIELGKENWEMAVYPAENHSFVEPTSWTDEYRRIFELFERTISRPGCTAGGALCAVPEVPVAATNGADRSGS